MKKLRILFWIFFQLLSFIEVYAQESNLVNINQIDSVGNRIGYWEYKEILFSGSRKGDLYGVFKGNYICNKENGIWSIFDHKNKLYEQVFYEYGIIKLRFSYLKGRIYQITSYKQKNVKTSTGQILVIGEPVKMTLLSRKGRVTDVIIFDDQGNRKSIYR